MVQSAAPVSRYPVLEIAGLVGALAGVARVAGIATVWVVGLAAHIGATLLTFAGIWILLVSGHADWSLANSVDVAVRNALDKQSLIVENRALR